MSLPQHFLDRPSAKAKHVAGRLCLDFVNLVGGWRDAEPGSKQGRFSIREDRLTDYLDIVAWAFRADLINETQVKRMTTEAARRPDDATKIWKRGQRLRDAIHSAATRIERGIAPESGALDVLSEEISRAWSKQRLTSGSPNLIWSTEADPASLDAPLAAVALSTEEFFTSADLTRLHSCPGDECGWMFEDTSRNRSRRWCDMGDCGNTAKVREFRSRQSGARRT
ncbi:MAG: CGNR zinc finger domain-containing protein [Vicinamibacteria bacterium]